MNVVRILLMTSLSFFVVACGADHEAQAAEAKTQDAADQVKISPVSQAVLSNLSTDLPTDKAAAVLSKFSEFRPDLKFTTLNTTAFPGLYEAEFEQGGVIYISESGDFFVNGEIFKIEPTGLVNISEEGRTLRRKEAIKNLDSAELISFPAEGDDVTDIYVFTDVHCGYCAKLHREVGELAKLGIRVNYLAFPRGGSRSQAYPIMQNVWCSDDPQQAMTDAKSGKTVASTTCSSTAVLDQFELGSRVGVNATPAIMFADGSLQLGYKPAAELAVIAKAKR